MVRYSWVALALIHFLPAIALFRPSMLTSLYGVEPTGPSFVLLWHRAALFLAMVIICLWAAMRADVRPLATVAIAISMVAFLLIYVGQGMPPALRTIALADLVGLPFLAVVGWNAFRPT